MNIIQPNPFGRAAVQPCYPEYPVWVLWFARVSCGDFDPWEALKPLELGGMDLSRVMQ